MLLVEYIGMIFSWMGSVDIILLYVCVMSLCLETWQAVLEIGMSQHSNFKKKILKLYHYIAQLRSVINYYETLFSGVQLWQSRNGFGIWICRNCWLRYNFMQKIKKKRQLYSGYSAIAKFTEMMGSTPFMQSQLTVQNFSLKMSQTWRQYWVCTASTQFTSIGNSFESYHRTWNDQMK